MGSMLLPASSFTITLDAYPSRLTPMSLHSRLGCARLVPMTCIWLPLLEFERPTTTTYFFLMIRFACAAPLRPVKQGKDATFIALSCWIRHLGTPLPWTSRGGTSERNICV